MAPNCPARIGMPHRYGAIRFLGVRHDQFIQTCRSCNAVRIGVIEQTDDKPKIIWGSTTNSDEIADASQEDNTKI